MRQETRFKFNAYLSRVAELNGIDAGDVSKKFTVEPSVTQTLMNTMQESSDFLTRINIVPVSEMKGEKIGIGVTGSIASTTDTAGGTERQPKDFSKLASSKYECDQINFDFYIRYKTLDLWARYQDFQLRMNTLANIQELARALRNMIRTGIIVETDLNAGRCRVQTGGMCTDWLQWLTHRAGRSRTWWAPSVGEQVLILAVGGELDTAFVLPGIYSGDNPAPSASADALHIRFPDGAVIEYEPETSALMVSGIKTASVTASDSVTATVPVVMVKASTRITLDTPEVVCTNRLITGTLEVQKGGTMRGNIKHTGGELSSNGKVLHTHKHPGDSGGTTGSPL